MKELIQAEFFRRKRENTNYSLRAFAAYLQVPAGRLSEIMSGKRAVSKKLQAKISSRLGFTDVHNFISSQNKSDYVLIPDDTFSVLADWYHFALLSLIETKDFRNDPKWIANRLNISPLESKAALQKLVRTGLIEIKNGKISKTNKNVKTTTDIQSLALRTVHKQKLEQAVRCLIETPIELRDITSITMAIDPKKLHLAKGLIKEFRLKMAEFLESTQQTEVYNLNIQLVPVSKKGGS